MSPIYMQIARGSFR